MKFLRVVFMNCFYLGCFVLKSVHDAQSRSIKKWFFSQKFKIFRTDSFVPTFCWFHFCPNLIFLKNLNFRKFSNPKRGKSAPFWCLTKVSHGEFLPKDPKIGFDFIFPIHANFIQKLGAVFSLEKPLCTCLIFGELKFLCSSSS